MATMILDNYNPSKTILLNAKIWRVSILINREDSPKFKII